LAKKLRFFEASKKNGRRYAIIGVKLLMVLARVKNIWRVLCGTYMIWMRKRNT
jgi:hypothetical protein